MATLVTYLARQPADEAVTANLSRIADGLDRFARAMRAAFPAR